MDKIKNWASNAWNAVKNPSDNFWIGYWVVLIVLNAGFFMWNAVQGSFFWISSTVGFLISAFMLYWTLWNKKRQEYNAIIDEEIDGMIQKAILEAELGDPETVDYDQLMEDYIIPAAKRTADLDHRISPWQKR